MWYHIANICLHDTNVDNYLYPAYTLVANGFQDLPAPRIDHIGRAPSFARQIVDVTFIVVEGGGVVSIAHDGGDIGIGDLVGVPERTYEQYSGAHDRRVSWRISREEIRTHDAGEHSDAFEYRRWYLNGLWAGFRGLIVASAFRACHWCSFHSFFSLLCVVKNQNGTSSKLGPGPFFSLGDAGVTPL